MKFMKRPSNSNGVFTSMLIITLMAGLLSLILLMPQGIAAVSFEEGQPAVVMLSASWCAKCRVVNNVLANVLSSNGKADTRIVTLDVDNTSTPAIAKRYGIQIGGADLPQVYWYQQGKTSLILSASEVNLGDEETTITTLGKRLK